MTRRGFLIAAFLGLAAAGAHADSAGEVADLFRRAAGALRDRTPAALWLLFDPKMAGYSRLRADSGALLAAAEAQSKIEIRKNEGDDRARSVELAWTLEIVRGDRSGASTGRSATIACRLEKRDGRWRIVSFAPLDFFAAPADAGAWETLAAAASALNRPLNLDETIPETDPAMFLEAFDPAMPGYATLRTEVAALMRRGGIESSLELVSDEGGDRARTLQIDWSLQVTGARTGIASISRRQTVRCAMERRRNRWRVVSFDPVAFFAP